MSSKKEVKAGNENYAKVLNGLIEINYPFVLLDVEQVSETTNSGIIKGESVKREETKKNHNVPVTIVLSNKESKYKQLDEVYVNAAMVEQEHIPFKFPETGDKVFILIDESFIFIKRK